jgi:cellulose synthase/poly-beta-1,6-N-acetylglucosamine synthase-like glycosyltransferase
MRYGNEMKRDVNFHLSPKRRSFLQRIRRSSVELPDRNMSYTYLTSVKRRMVTKKRQRKPMMALLIAAHNEELVIEKTLRSAIASGMKPVHIYVVDDNSQDLTSKIAKSILPPVNVLKVSRSGKGLALAKGANRFKLTQRYRWIHIADADGAFSPNYFRVFRRELRVKNAAATGYIRSLPGKRVSEYRVFEYTVAMEIHRRLQAMLHVVPVIPGPTSCFRSDVFEKINFDNKSLTEDFDATMQIHRLKLGKIQFIPAAVAYTQDPQNIREYTKQITRWNRGGLQSIVKYRIGRQLSGIDIYLTYQILQNFLFFVSYLIWVPYLTWVRHNDNVLATAFVIDVLVTFMITYLSAARTRRWDVVSAFPQIYVIRWVSLAVFLKAFVEVIILRKFRHTEGLWENRESRRYVVESA